MAEFVDSYREGHRQRLDELKEEVAKLEAARAALVGRPSWPGPPRGTHVRTQPPRRRGARRPGRPRGRRGGNTRANQALELVRGKPGITIPQIAEQMGSSRTTCTA